MYVSVDPYDLSRSLILHERGHVRACAGDIGQDYFAVYTARSFNSIPYIRIDRAQMVPAIINRVYDRVRACVIADLRFSVRD